MNMEYWHASCLFGVLLDYTCLDARRCCNFCFNFYFKYVWLHMNVYACLYCTTMRVCLHVCAHVWIQGLLIVDRKTSKKKVNTDLCSAISSIFHQKESYGGRKEMDRKKKQILKCALKKSRLKAPFFSPFFLASFFAAIERSRMIVGCSCKWRG